MFFERQFKGKCFSHAARWLLCMLLSLTFFNAYPQQAKTTNVSVVAGNKPLKEVFRELEQKTGLSINYQDNVVDASQKVDISVSNKPLSAVLDQLLGPLGATYSQQGNMILIVKKAVVAQKKPVVLTIVGQVTDEENNEALIGVGVRVKGMDIGVTTDTEGRFSIKLPQMSGVILLFSYIGYKPQELKLNNRTGLQVHLQKDTKGLDEVVVVGYGTVKKKDLTGAVGSVDMESMYKAPVATFDQALAGRVAGVMVSSSEGQPGSPINIIIRGNNSLTQENSPLYVIDGFPIENPDNGVLNPDDIESIDILKDASASAIYGARGANGVIIITTKRGKEGAPVIRYSGSYGTQQNLKEIPVMGAYEFVKLQNEIKVGDLNETYLANNTSVDDYKNASSIDWQHQLFRTAPMQNHSLSLSGGTAQTKYTVSGQLLDQQGIIINSGFKRYQGKVSLDQTVTDKLKVGINVLYTNTQTYGTQPSSQSLSSMNNLLYSAWGYRPVSPLNPLKTVGEDFEDDLYDDMVSTGTDYRLNPIITAENEYRKRILNNLVANGYLEYTILKDLKLRVSGGINQRIQRNEAFNNSKTRSGNPYTVYGINGSVINQQTTNWLNENTLTYNRQFGKDHRLNVVAGMTMQGNRYSSYGASANQLPNESLGLSGLSQGVPQPVNSYLSEWSMVSALSRVNYTFKDRYLFTASYRADGSSKFRANNQWSYFPSGALAWRISNESFMKRLSFISDAKARVSWGITGNNRVSEYATYAALSFPMNGYYSYNNAIQQGAVLSSLASEDLKWENTSQTDVGLDLGFFKQRLSLTVDYYKKVTSNLLLYADLPPTTGYGKAYKNVGKTSNEGLEISLSGTPVSTKVFSWNSSFNISFNRSKVLALTQNQETLTSTMSWDSFYKDPLYLAKIGQPLGQFYGYIWDGVYQYDDFVQKAGAYVLKDDITANGTARNLIQPGDIKYRDINGDGDVNADDRTVTGRGFPVHIGGFTNNFSYKNFDLNIFFQWSYGNDIFNANRLNFETGNKVYLNQYKSFEDRWTPENTNTTMPRAGGQSGYKYSTRIMEDGSYLRLKTLQLGYNLPSEVVKRLKIRSCRFYIAAQNLITWTNYSGADPEVSVNYSALTPGFDYSAYPRARTTTIGVNLSL